MRRVFVTVLVVAASIAGAGIAQIARTPDPFSGAWFDMQPGVPDYRRNYPREAFAQRIEGAALLCCDAREDRWLDCRSAFEWPQGHGFGEASVVVSREFRMSEESYELYRQDPGNWLRRIIVWRLGREPTPEFENALEMVRTAAPDACNPAEDAVQ